MGSGTWGAQLQWPGIPLKPHPNLLPVSLNLVGRPVVCSRLSLNGRGTAEEAQEGEALET